MGLAAVAVAALLCAGCGGGSSADSNEHEGTYTVGITNASFPTEQVLGQTSLLDLTVKNEGKKTLPSLTVTFTIAGSEGQDSAIAFAVREPQEGLANSDRPAWVLSQGYPKLQGVGTAGGAATSNPKTFSFGPLKPGESRAAVWKLSAVRQGKYTLHYNVGAGLGEGVHAKTPNGVAPGGTFEAEISAETPDTEVTDAGEIVPLGTATSEATAAGGGGKSSEGGSESGGE
jgi:hypothetical protein